MMFGSEPVKAYQENCRFLVSQLIDQRGEEFYWEDIYQFPDAKDLILVALITMA